MDDIEAIRERIRNNENLLGELERKQPFDDSYAPDDRIGTDIAGYISDMGRGVLGMVGASEDIPRYTPSRIFSTMVQEAEQRRDMGLSPEELGLRKQLAERGYGYDVKNIKRLAGGSAGVALGNFGRATDQLYTQYSGIAADDEAVRRQNRQLFNRAALSAETVNRQIFDDELKQAMLNKEAASGLVSDALSNIRDRRDYEKAYGKGSDIYEYRKELTLSQRQNRQMLDEANRRRSLEMENELRNTLAEDRALLNNYDSLNGDEEITKLPEEEQFKSPYDTYTSEMAKLDKNSPDYDENVKRLYDMYEMTKGR
jgi:hypothetical protein